MSGCLHGSLAVNAAGSAASCSSGSCKLPPCAALGPLAHTLNRGTRPAGNADIVFTIAGQPGTSAVAADGAVASASTLKDPYSVAYDSSGNLFILESGFTGRLYLVTPGGIIKDLTLGGSTFSMASDVFTLANGSLVVVMGDAHHACLYKSPTSCVTLVGTPGSAGYSGNSGAATSAQLNSPSGGLGHPTNPNRFWIAGGCGGRAEEGRQLLVGARFSPAAAPGAC